MITAQQVVEIMMDLPDDGLNPMEYLTCVYTDPEDTDQHCIAGEVISRLGYRLPDINDRMNEDSIIALLDNPKYTLSKSDFEPLAVEMLWAAQITADNSDSDTGDQNTWDVAKDSAFKTYIDGMLGDKW
jgi:hypothetical protein